MPQSNNINNSTSNCNIGLNDRVKKSRAHKKSKCLDTASTRFKCTANQTEAVVKEKKKKTRKPYSEASYYLFDLLDKVVYEWFQRAQRLIETGIITNEMFLQKAHECKQIFGIPNFITDYEWVWNFRKKYNITNLDMTMLRIENDNRSLLSVDINDIIIFVLSNHTITEDLTYTTTRETLPSNINNINEPILPLNINETEEVELDVLPVISNDEEAMRYLKPLEDYVLLRENFRAIGLISQLEEMFASETNKSVSK